MPLATKNGSLIVKDGSIAENCECCGGGCVNSTRVSRADMWLGSQAPPSSIRVKIEHTNEKRNFINNFGNDSGSVFKCCTVWADPSRDAEYTLSREVFNPVRGGDGHCRYYGTGALGALSINPGVACGGGWDAVIASLMYHVVVAVSSSQLDAGSLPLVDNAGFVQQSEPSVCGTLSSGFSVSTTTAGVFYYPDPGTPGGSRGAGPYVDLFTFPVNAYYSIVPCSTSANSTLAGFVWEGWCYPLTFARRTSTSSGGVLCWLAPFKAVRISVV